MKTSFGCLAALLCVRAGLCQVAVLQIRIVEGDGAVHAAGSRASRPLVVEVTEETGRPAAGAAVSFHLPEDGASGAFTNGLRTEVLTADSGGRVTLRGLQLNRVAGRFQIRITASLEQARAGTVSFQYIADTRVAPAAASVRRQSSGPVATSSQGRKWWLVAVLAGAGAAAAGGMATHGGSGRTPAPPATIAAAAIIAPPPPVLTIGPPAVTVGKP